MSTWNPEVPDHLPLAPLARNYAELFLYIISTEVLQLLCKVDVYIISFKNKEDEIWKSKVTIPTHLARVSPCFLLWSTHPCLSVQGRLILVMALSIGSMNWYSTLQNPIFDTVFTPPWNHRTQGVYKLLCWTEVSKQTSLSHQSAGGQVRLPLPKIHLEKVSCTVKTKVSEAGWQEYPPVDVWVEKKNEPTFLPGVSADSCCPSYNLGLACLLAEATMLVHLSINTP